MRAVLALALVLATTMAHAAPSDPPGRFEDGRGYAAEALDRLLSRETGDGPVEPAAPEDATDC